MEYRCNTPVVLIFFNRPDTFEKVFAEVRKAKPSALFLVQDGPRSDADLPGIEACRKIVDTIDWDCEVTKDFSDVNLGCGMRPQTGITNALKKYERVIILEDDCVPSPSFFPYCEELLEKYKDDERICYISGLNHFEEWDGGDGDYFFTKTGAIWGWATWRRAWARYDYFVSDITDEKNADRVSSQITHPYIAKTRRESWLRANRSAASGEKLSYWDVQWGFVKYAQNMLVIVPRKNQIGNIGIGAGSTHAQSLKNATFVKYKNFVFIPTHTLKTPLTHPRIVVCDTAYDDLVYQCTAGNPVRRVVARAVKKWIKR